MSEPLVFDPRRAAYKSPFGAAPCGKTITLNCRPPLEERFTHCALILYHEFSDRRQEIVLKDGKPEGGRACFTTEFSAPREPELTWYWFHLWRDDGSGCDLDKTGYRSDGNLDPWQLTTYRPSHTPKWFGEGITYQIFPDRFHRLSVPDPKGLVGNRWVHETWEEQPAWQPDPDGEIRNRDFFGGSLAGIMEKLDDLADMGVTTLYLCPIFESASNHRYNTADYTRIDPFLGTEADFRALCDAAHQRGMKIMLDGVFNHTGSQSIYFNEDGFYPSVGAAQSKSSPFYNWFQWKHWPDDFESWWGIKTLPAVQEETKSYTDYIIDDQDSIIRRWLREGADGWRLDVADELPDSFIEKIRTAMDETKEDAFLLGEVWEDASTKIAYSQRRRYFQGSELHGVMNYPFRTALLEWLQGGDAGNFMEAMEALRENYPPDAFYSALNFLGTHDTARILTVLGASEKPDTKEARAAYRLSPAERQRGGALVKLAAQVLFTFPGSPMVYYGDEAAMEGWEDPFNRGTYPWGREDLDMKAHFTRLSRLRSRRASLRTGDLTWLQAKGHVLAFSRTFDGERSVSVLNAAGNSATVSIPWEGTAVDALSGCAYESPNGLLTLTLPPYGGLLLI